VLQAQVDSLLRGEGDIQDSCTQTEETLAGEACAASLQAEQGLAERLEELTNQGLPCHPEENDQLDLILETDGLRKSIHNLGSIATTSAVASHTVATGDGLRQCAVGVATSITVTTKDKDGELCKTGNAVLAADLAGVAATVGDGPEVGEIVDNKNGTYEYSYRASKEGSLTLSLRLYDQHIKGSPFKIKAVKAIDISPSSEGAKSRLKSPGSGHVKQKAIKRPASMYSTGKRKENPIEDDLIYRIGSLHFRLLCLNYDCV
jgi:tripartite motif-containing protein 2/3